jgi:hypothetical protein
VERFPVGSLYVSSISRRAWRTKASPPVKSPLLVTIPSAPFSIKAFPRLRRS